MSDIRVTYSGLIGFTISLSTAFTSLVFILIITRTLSVEEFGTWSILGTMVSYFIISERIISYWTTRQVARGEEVGFTSISTSLLFSLGAIPLYIVFVYFVSVQSEINFETMLMGAIMIPVYFVSTTLIGINMGHKPHVTSYGLLAFETFKIPAALALVYFLDLGVPGAVIAITLSYIVRIIFQLYFARKKIRERFKLKILKRWLKLSWIPIYNYLFLLVIHLDIVIYTSIIGSLVGVAYYSASLSIGLLVIHSAMINQALYPKLLSKGREAVKSLNENFSLLLYFSIPLLTITILFAKPALFALNPVYDTAAILVSILSLKIFFFIIGAFFGQALKGLETIDREQNPQFLNFVKSKLFLVPTIRIIQAGLYIVTLTVVFFVFNGSEMEVLELITLWAMIGLAFEIPISIILLAITRKNIEFQFPFKNFIKYSLASIAFVLVFEFTSDYFIKYHISIYDFLPGVIIQSAICVGVYLVITYLIDKKTKILFKTILNEIITKKRN